MLWPITLTSSQQQVMGPPRDSIGCEEMMCLAWWGTLAAPWRHRMGHGGCKHTCQINASVHCMGKKSSSSPWPVLVLIHLIITSLHWWWRTQLSSIWLHLLPKYESIMCEVFVAPIVAWSDTETALKDHENGKRHTQHLKLFVHRCSYHVCCNQVLHWVYGMSNFTPNPQFWIVIKPPCDSFRGAPS